MLTIFVYKIVRLLAHRVKGRRTEFWRPSLRILESTTRKPTGAAWDNRMRGHCAHVQAEQNVTMRTPSIIPKNLCAKGTGFWPLVAGHLCVRQQEFSSGFSKLNVFSLVYLPGLCVLWKEHFQSLRTALRKRWRTYKINHYFYVETLRSKKAPISLLQWFDSSSLKKKRLLYCCFC